MSKTPPPLYQVLRWTELFENDKSIGYVRPQIVCIPNDTSLGDCAIQGEDEGAAINGIWTWIIKLCSRQTCGSHYKDDRGKKRFRSARNGYLTEDGWPTGRRLSIQDLSHVFRRRAQEVETALSALCRADAGFMRIVPESEIIVTASHINHEAMGIHDHTPGSPALNHGLPPIEQNRTEQNRDTCSTSLVSAAESVVQDDPNMIHSEQAKKLIGDLVLAAFDRKVREADWRNPEKDRWLQDALPITPDEWFAVNWFYRLPPDDEALKRTARVQSFEAFLENLKREIDKAKSIRRQLGLNGAHPAGEEIEPDDGWTRARMAAACELFGPKQPGRFVDLGSSACRKVDEKIGSMKTEAAR